MIFYKKLVILPFLIHLSMHAMHHSQQSAVTDSDQDWGFVESDIIAPETVQPPIVRKTITNPRKYARVEKPTDFGATKEAYVLDPKQFRDLAPDQKRIYLYALTEQLDQLNYEQQKALIIKNIEQGIHPDEIRLTWYGRNFTRPGTHALELAARENDEDFVRLLLQHGAQPNTTQHSILFSVKKYPIARLLIDHGASTDAFDAYKTMADNPHELPFLHHIAISPEYDAQLLPLYVNNGADVSVLDNDGNTALMSLIEVNYGTYLHKSTFDKAQWLTILGVPLDHSNYSFEKASEIKLLWTVRQITWRELINAKIAEFSDRNSALKNQYSNLKKAIIDAFNEPYEVAKQLASTIGAQLPLLPLDFIEDYKQQLQLTIIPLILSYLYGKS